MNLYWLLTAGHGAPLNVYEIKVEKTMVPEGQGTCLKCMYDLKKGEKVTDLIWYQEETPLFHYSHYQDIPLRAFFESKNLKVNVSICTQREARNWSQIEFCVLLLYLYLFLLAQIWTVNIILTNVLGSKN